MWLITGRATVGIKITQQAILRFDDNVHGLAWNLARKRRVKFHANLGLPAPK